MKKRIALFLSVAVAVTACESKFDDLSFNGGTADFSKYVALGNSLTAGYADNALYVSGQTNSYPAILAQQMQMVGGGTFVQPYMSDDLGGMTLAGTPISGNKYILGYGEDCLGATSLGPQQASGTGTTDVANNIYSSGPFNNMGIPGAKASHLIYKGFGSLGGMSNGTANPYFVRMSSDDSATVLGDAMAQSPTFFSLWIGNNDVLGFATTGGADPTSPITTQAEFDFAYDQLVTTLTSNGAKGVVANIPDVTSIPYFTTVPYNAIPLDAGSAGNLNIIFNGIADYCRDSLNMGATAEQYRINWVEGGNAMLIDVPKTTSNPLGWRQITADELVVLVVPQDSIKCAGYGTIDTRGFSPLDPPSSNLARVSPLMNQHVLTADEIDLIEAATAGFNATIAAAASKHNLALADMHANLANIRNNGIVFNEVEYTTTFATGGSFSLDGVHLTQRGYALTANYFIDAINAKYGANMPKVDMNSYPGTELP